MRLYRLKQVATILNIGMSTIVEFLAAMGVVVENKPTTKITEEHFNLLVDELALEIEKVSKSEERFANLNVSYVSAVSRSKRGKRKERVEPKSKGFQQYLDLMSHILNAGLSRNETADKHIEAAKTGRILPYFFESIGDGSKIEEVDTVSNNEFTFGTEPNTYCDAITERIAYLCQYADNEYEPRYFSKDQIVNLLSQINYDRSFSGAETKAAIKRRLKGFAEKQCKQDIKLRLRSIISPRLFHVFTDEEDVNEVAKSYLRFSIEHLYQLREACLNTTRLKHEGFTYIN